MKFIHGLEQPLRCIGSTSRNGPAKLISFFFSELGIPSERTFLGLLHCLLTQLLVAMPEVVPSVRGRYQKLLLRSGAGSRNSSIWTETELQGAFDDIVLAQKSSASVLCIVDGLDECEESKIHESLRFLRKLADLPTTSLLRFKVLCSSRPETAIEIGLSRYPFFRVQDHTSSDIRKFVTETFAAMTENLNSGDPVVEIVDDLIAEIVMNAEGVFIWARLVVAETVIAIETGDIIAQENFLNELPSDLEELYDRIICKIPKKYLHETIKYLRYIRHCSCHNLLGMTVAVQPPDELLTDQSKYSKCMNMKRLLRSRCRGLVTLPTLNPKWTFKQHSKKIMTSFCMANLSIHRTVKEFIFCEERLAKLYTQMDTTLLDDEATQDIAYKLRLWRCDPLLQAQVFDCTSLEEYEINHGEPPFTTIFHSLLCELRLNEAPRSTRPLAATWLPVIDSYLKQTLPTVEAYEEFLDNFVKHDYICFERFAEDPAISPWHTDILCLAIKFELFSYVQEHPRSDSANKSGRPLLHYTLSWGLSDAMEMSALLFSQGCRPETEFNFRSTWEFVLIASFSWYIWNSMDKKLTEVIPLFLQHGADPNQRVDMHDYQCFALHVLFTTTPLNYEILAVILQNMLDRGAHVNALDSKGRSVIDLARKNRPEVVSLLERYAARPDAPPVLNNGFAMSEKIGTAEGISNVSETLLLAVEVEERGYQEFPNRRPLRITHDYWAGKTNVSTAASNAAVRMSNVLTDDDSGIPGRLSVDEQDGNDEGFLKAASTDSMERSLTEQLEDCRISDLN